MTPSGHRKRHKKPWRPWLIGVGKNQLPLRKFSEFHHSLHQKMPLLSRGTSSGRFPPIYFSSRFESAELGKSSSMTKRPPATSCNWAHPLGRPLRKFSCGDDSRYSRKTHPFLPFPPCDFSHRDPGAQGPSKTSTLPIKADPGYIVKILPMILLLLYSLPLYNLYNIYIYIYISYTIKNLFSLVFSSLPAKSS